jgi:pyruvate formate lyase activating enzyme
MKCDVCFHHCDLKEGQTGFCRARMKEGKDRPRELWAFDLAWLSTRSRKKPLKEFYPGSLILSCGSYGCNLRCPFCQNFEISQYNRARKPDFYSPEELVKLALKAEKKAISVWLSPTTSQWWAMNTSAMRPN